MNASTDEIAVIQTRLPYTDRRALSQAWFSALHCASAGAGEEARRSPEAPAFSTQARSVRVKQEKELIKKRASSSIAPSRNVLAIRPQSISHGMHEADPARVRRSGCSKTSSQEISRENIEQAHFTMTAGGVRAALHVRRVGGKLIIIAVCSARHVEVVRRSLAEAAIGMRLQGEHADTSVRVVDEEKRP